MDSIRNLCQTERLKKSRISKNSIKTVPCQSNRTFVTRKNDKKLNLDKTVVDISINTPVRRSFTDKR